MFMPPIDIVFNPDLYLREQRHWRFNTQYHTVNKEAGDLKTRNLIPKPVLVNTAVCNPSLLQG